MDPKGEEESKCQILFLFVSSWDNIPDLYLYK